MVEPKSNEVLVEPKVRRGKKVKAKKERKKSKVKVVDDIPAAQTPGASPVIETPPPPKDAERETEVVEESNPVLSCPPPDDVEDIQKEEEQREEEKGDQEGIDVLQGEDVASKGDTQGGTGVDGASKKQGSHRVSFMDIAACPTLARAAMVQSQGLLGGDEKVISAIAADPKDESSASGDVLGAVAKAVQRESHVDNIISKRMLKKALLVRRTLERCAKCLKDAARARYQCTMSANLAARSMFDYIARMNQQQEDQDESFVVVGDFTASSWESALDEDDGRISSKLSSRSRDDSRDLLEVGQTFMRRLESVIVPPNSIEEDEASLKLLSGSRKLMELSVAIQAVVKELVEHEKSCPSAQEILQVQKSMGTKDSWIAACEYNVLLRQALLANRERRGLCERLTELVEQKQVCVLHDAISAVESTVLPDPSLEMNMEKLTLLSSALVGEKSSSFSETNQAGNSVDALLEQRLIECAGSLFDEGRADVLRQGVLEMQLATSSKSSQANDSATAWTAIRAVLTAGGNFCWFSNLIATPNGIDGFLIPDGTLQIKGLSVEPEEAPKFDLVEAGSWGRSKKRHKFRAVTVEDSVEWILHFKDLSNSKS